MLQIYCVEHRITDMGQAETKIFENAPAWHESDVLATTDFEEEVELLCAHSCFDSLSMILHISLIIK